ncbi:LexA family transcriptional regulator [Halostella litorea]|uniref:hypothetical protein n=1 Tax=Halostella litorea TaxID=2528831 RepID=UPI00109283E9|nr:hypothetical protein [Halostella litorea]
MSDARTPAALRPDLAPRSDDPEAVRDAIRAFLREYRERTGPYCKSRDVARALGLSTSVVGANMGQLREAGDLETWGNGTPTTYRITLDEDGGEQA